MERRTFLRSLLQGAAGLTAAAALPVFDPEHALWVPGVRSFFDLGATRPDSLDWMNFQGGWPIEYVPIEEFRERYPGDNLLTLDLITREALAVLKNQLNFASRVHRSYDDEFGCVGPGTVIYAHVPVRIIQPRYAGRISG